MAFKKETLAKIVSILKIKEADFTAALTSDTEVDLEIPAVQTFTDEELNTRDENKKNDGIKAGKEIGAKEVRKAAGLEDEVGKDPAKIAQAIIDKAVKDANLKPDEKVKQLNDQIATLQNTVLQKDTELNTVITQAKQSALDNKILAAFPKNRAETLTDGEYLTLIKSQVSIEEQDGKLIAKKDGVIIQDKLANPLPLTDVITNVFTERKWVAAEGNPGGGAGRGGGDKGGTKVTSLKELTAKYEADGKSIQGAEFSNELAGLVKENKDFDLTP